MLLRPGGLGHLFGDAAGVGITAMMTPRLGIRAQADVQIAGSTDAYLQGTSIFPRTTVGAVIRLGRTR